MGKLIMKNTIFSTAIIILILGYVVDAQATPQGRERGFESCGEGRIDSQVLRKAQKDELVEGYCACITIEKLNEKKLVNHPTPKTINRTISNARTNARTIFRILKKNHGYSDAPKCAIK